MPNNAKRRPLNYKQTYTNVKHVPVFSVFSVFYVFPVFSGNHNYLRSLCSNCAQPVLCVDGEDMAAPCTQRARMARARAKGLLRELNPVPLAP